MHRVDCVIHHWFVPLRIIWDNFESFITGGPSGNSTPSFPLVQAPVGTGYQVGSLADYLGRPMGISSDQTSALPFRAYAKIFNEYYRDQDLQTELPIATTDGLDFTTSQTLQYAPWEKDYFTTARPWTQKGSEVALPLTGDAPVLREANADHWKAYLEDSDTIINGDLVSDASGNVLSGALGASLDPNGGLYADLSGVTAVTVNELRLAMALERFKENMARYGSRYSEYLLAHGVKSSDARLQRPEYLGGGRQTLQFSEVLQTAEGENPVGELRGHGIGAIRSNRFRKFFEEHGLVISLMSVKPKTVYTQGSARMWNRRVKEDFYTRELAHIGQQEVLNKEIYAAGPDPTGVFGYQDRYDEYRRTESSVAGEFRTSLLNYWHFAREFNSAPALNAAFVSSADVTDRPFAVGGQDVLYCMANHQITVKSQVARKANSFIR